MRFALPLLLLALGLRAQDASYKDELIARARAERIASEPAWLALGHYKGRVSEVEASEFFTAPDGRKNAAAELESTLAAFFAPEPDPKDERAQHPQCRFPARWHWAKERFKLDLSRLPERRCARFEDWRDTIGAQSVTLVFADAFLNNPASMYGHTFLRLRRAGALPGEDLLDYTVNFAGTPDTANPVFYAVEGIFGLFPGAFSTMPYYMKTQEYTNIESRDLWEYDLSFTPEQTAALVRHLWEMGSAKFNYYFFSQNCSYQLLSLVDGAVPGLGLSKGFGFGVVPLDTVRAFGERGLYTDAKRRPSHVSQMLARRSRLEGDEARLAKDLARRRPGAWERLEPRTPERKSLVLDSAHDYLRFTHGFGPNLGPEEARTERELLVARGRLKLPPAPEPEPRRLRPDLGHATKRAGILQGADERGAFTEVQFRMALHDLPTPGEGYIADSQLEMGEVRLRYDYEEKQPFIEKLDIVDIVTLAPADPWIKRASWKASFGVDQARELGCVGVDCMYGALNVGMGPSLATGLFKREVWYLFGEGDFGAAPVFRDGWRLGGGGTAGVVVDLGSRLRLHGEGTLIKYTAGRRRERARAVLAFQASPEVELRLHFDRRTPSTEGGLAAFLYF